MTGKGSVVGTEHATRILKALGMPKAVNLMRYMHMNGWFAVPALAGALDMQREELLVHLAALEEADLVERRVTQGHGAVEFRVRREFPEVSLTRLATEEGQFLKAAKFYSNLVVGAIERSKELNGGLQEALKLEVSNTNGWHDGKAKAVLSCLDLNGPAVSTYENIRRMVAQQVLSEEDLPVLKKVFLSLILAIIRCAETRSGRNISRLLMRVASRNVLEQLGEDVRAQGLLEGIPEEYYRQV